MKKKIKQIFFLCFFSLFLFSLYQPTFAYLPCEPEDKCTKSSDCKPIEGYNVSCINQCCTYIPISPLDKTRKALEDCQKNGSTSQECYLIGTSSLDPENGYSGIIENTVNGLNIALLGLPPTEDELSSGKIKAGLIAQLGSFIDSLYENPPASSVNYFADLLQNLGISKNVYAQGIGFKAMGNLLPLWKVSRNIAYIFFTIIFIFIGLAIILRIKIDPKTVVTIQNALPKLIITLILITFSYAIVGLMIDLSYLIIRLGVLFASQTGYISPTELTQKQDWYGSLSFWDAIKEIFINNLQFKSLIPSAVGAGVGALVALLITSSGGLIGLGGVIGFLLFAIIILWCLFKLFLSLVNCYIQIILSLILGPIQIAAGALPGNQGGFNSWLKNLTANILVFPAVSLTFLLTSLLLKTGGPTWRPPVIAPSGGLLTTILAIGMILLLPKIPDMVKSAFKMKPAGYGAAIGEAIKPIQPLYKAGASAAVSKLEVTSPGWGAVVSTLTGAKGSGGRGKSAKDRF